MNKTRLIIMLICIAVVLGVASAPGFDTKSSPAKRNLGPDSASYEQPSAPALQSPLSGEKVKWQVIAGGGTRGTSTNFALTGTAGQTAVGKGSSPNFGVNQGFWQNFAATNCTCGDANGDGSFNISDVVFVIQYIFAGGSAPSPICHGDANGDGNVNISDAVYLIQYIFGGGPAPHCP